MYRASRLLCDDGKRFINTIYHCYLLGHFTSAGHGFLFKCLRYAAEIVPQLVSIPGCMTYDGVFYRPGSSIEVESRDGTGTTKCRCISGDDPFLADAYVLYHFRCPDHGSLPVEVFA